jgi:hypothetical protein
MSSLLVACLDKLQVSVTSQFKGIIKATGSCGGQWKSACCAKAGCVYLWSHAGDVSAAGSMPRELQVSVTKQMWLIQF